MLIRLLNGRIEILVDIDGDENFSVFFLINSEIDNKVRALDSEYQESLEMVQTLEKKHREMDEERYEITNELKKQQDLLTQRERELAELMKDYEYAKDKEAVLNADR